MRHGGEETHPVPVDPGAFEVHLAKEFAVENLKAWQALRWWQIGIATLKADEAIRGHTGATPKASSRPPLGADVLEQGRKRVMLSHLSLERLP